MVLHQSDASTQAAAISAGDLVIVYMSHNAMKGVTVKPNAVFSNKYGNFLHNDWIGRPYGSKVFSKTGAWVYLLLPSPELWSQVLQHRTQILYVADISLICAGLDLRPGAVVLESGTGSGSLTHSLARAVAPHGEVHTFEFHEVRCEEAGRELERNGVSQIVRCSQRNIEELGFPEELHGHADGVILDLPGPWKVVESAARCLKPNGRFCGFSPCIEQVQRTAQKLRSTGFTDVQCVECLLRYYEVKREALVDPDVDASLLGGGEKGEGEDAGGGGAGGRAEGPERVPTASPAMLARGHTGYLLFARKIVPLSAIAGAATT